MSPKERVFAELCRVGRCLIWFWAVTIAASNLAQFSALGVRAHIEAEARAQFEIIKMLKEAGVEVQAR